MYMIPHIHVNFYTVQCSIKKLEIDQKRAIKVLKGLPYDGNIYTYFKRNNLLSIQVTDINIFISNIEIDM